MALVYSSLGRLTHSFFQHERPREGKSMKEKPAGARTLEDAATKFLRKKGFRWDGRANRCGVDKGQSAFERRLICTPTGRRPEWRRSK